MTASRRQFCSDPQFHLALVAGVLFWLMLFALLQPATDLAWPLRTPAAFLLVALLYPVVEEIVFRGLIQDLIHKHVRSWKLGPLSHANVLTSLLFSALHLLNHPPLWALGVLAPSLLFGYFKDRTGTLGAPIALHVFYNSGYFWIFTH